MQPIKTAFFSGTFNPVHTGHLILANYLCEYEGFDEIWLSVSPQNPLREKLSSNNDRQRIEMLNMAVNGNSKIRTTDIEFTLPLLYDSNTRSPQKEASRKNIYFDYRCRQLAFIQQMERLQ